MAAHNQCHDTRNNTLSTPKQISFRGFSLLTISLTLQGCGAWDFSDKGLHESFVIHHNTYVGKKTIAYIERKYLRPISSKLLPSGNMENEYLWGPGTYTYPGVKKAQCHYFYEYAPQTGLIVGFRFEEKFKHACRETGA